ncbi:olfactory receptor 1L4-like [Rhinatrema bivittatum]|uniref:olfactory receptor 1L4-like n=1 Tax=Rhinatrema bivittatum TaxID=194408 RepID=UPI00112B2553|nr:olfactory receptor 1L4-like [Rhinatrema bivittatum]
MSSALNLAWLERGTAKEQRPTRLSLIFSDYPQLQVPLFLVFLLIYLITLLGNLVLITVTCADPRLHTPMYFFLSNLSVTDIYYTSVIIPKLCGVLLSEDKTISYVGCLLQLYVFISSGGAEAFLLTAMAYDRYVAVCHPLNYALIMSQKVCWITSLLSSGAIVVSVSHLSFCDSNMINHFFCDLMPLLKLSCMDTTSSEAILFVCLTVPAFLVTLLTYIYIISAILRIRSAEGKRKAFPTCSSHLTIVIVFDLSIFFVYLRPTSSYFLEEGTVLSVLYAAVTPMLNSIIYSLRNKEVKNALKKVIGKELVALCGVKITSGYQMKETPFSDRDP